MDLEVQFSVYKRSEILESYFSTKSVVLTQRKLSKEFPGRKIPWRKRITKIDEKFRNAENVRNDNKGHIGRYGTVKTHANVQAVREHLEQSPRKSTRRLSQEVGILRTAVQGVIHNDLKLFPYKVQILQKQIDSNKEERSQFCQSISDRIKNNPGDLCLIVLSDKAYFHLSRHVNKQNMRFWASQQLHKHTQQPLSHGKFTVWCAIGKGEIFRPYFFEDNDGNRVTVDAQCYIEMMRRMLVPALKRRRGIDMNTVVFQQDGAPPHCSNRTLEYFPEDRLISRWTDSPWPPYSTDHNPSYHFLWGYLKDKIY